MAGKRRHLAQAKAFLSKNFLALGQSRHYSKRSGDEKNKIFSIETFEKYARNIKLAAESLGVTKIKHITPAMAQSYLETRSKAGLSPKQLHSDSRALSMLIGQKLEKVKTLAPAKQTLYSRAYTVQQMTEIANRQSPKNGLATRIAYDAGLRGQELLTLRRTYEGKPASEYRQWSQKRFKGRSEGVRYLVTGKGGLVREVMISQPLAVELEARRLDVPVLVKDRGVNGIAKHYDISGGHTWAKSFSRTSISTFKRSTGAHGLRHSYAQERVNQLITAGYSFNETLGIVANEMGHFREKVTKTYLR